MLAIDHDEQYPLDLDQVSFFLISDKHYPAPLLDTERKYKMLPRDCRLRHCQPCLDASASLALRPHAFLYTQALAFPPHKVFLAAPLRIVKSSLAYPHLLLHSLMTSLED